MGAVNKKETLSYTSLFFQMKRDKEAEYGSKEVSATVIRAIKPGSNQRNYLESKINI